MNSSTGPTDAKACTGILFVCLGNICRSPLAEGVFRNIIAERGIQERFIIDSAGIGGWHAGSAPDARSVRVAHKFGVDIADQVCRQIRLEDFSRFDLIFGMDRSNVAELRAARARETAGRVHLFYEYATGMRHDVPDPYYGGADDFETAYRMIREAADALAEKLG